MFSWLKRVWKRFTCFHDYQYERTVQGEVVNRNVYRCALCGKKYGIKYSADRSFNFPFRDSHAVIGEGKIWCGVLDGFIECPGFTPGPPNTSFELAYRKKHPLLCGQLEPFTGECLKYKKVDYHKK